MSSLNIQVCDKLEPLYKLGKIIGFPGAYGKAYEIEYLKIKKPIMAVKCIDKSRVKAKMIETEIQMCALLRDHPHPNVMWVDGVVNTPHNLYIIMDMYNGGDLFDLLDIKGSLPISACRKILRQLLHATNHMHTKMGIVHGDLKLSNIMISDKSPDALIKIIDFGLAQKLKPGQFVLGSSGTLCFQPPEQIKGYYNEKADIYSLGIILFIMIFTFNPFDAYAEHEKALIELRILKGFESKVKRGRGAHFPSEIESSAEVRDLISQMLQYDPNNRPNAEQALKHPWFM